MPQAIVGVLISLAISAAFTIISRLLAPHNQAPIGPQLPTVKDPGTQLTLRNAAESHQVVFGRRRVKGNIVFAQCTDQNAYLHLVIVWAGHECAEFGDLYFNDEVVPLSGNSATGTYAGFAECYDHLGAADQAADSTLVGRCGDKWTTAHRGRGVAYSYIRLKWDRAKFPQALPNVWRIVKGMKVYDPRAGTTAWSDNAALCAAAFMASAKFGRGIPYGGLNGIDATALSAAANVCDETVTLAAGGTEKRYTCNAVLASDTAFVDNLEKLLSAMAGSATPVGGAWILKAAAWQAAVELFDEDDFRAGFTVQNGIGNADAFNAIKGKYANPDKLFQPDDFPAITSDVYEDEDGGDREFKDVALDCTTSAAMAQRLARIDLRRARQPLTFTAQLRLRALRVQPGDTVAVSFAFLGWIEKPFRVEKMKLVLGFGPGGGGDGGEPGIIGADLELRETAEAIYDWNPALDEQAVDPAPNTTFPNPFTALPPSNLTATESLYSTRDGGGVKAKVRLAWGASPDAFVTSGGGYRVSYKLATDSSYAVAGVTPALFFDLLDVASGTYDFRVEAINWAGNPSGPLTVRQSIAGLSAAPAAPTGFTVNAIAGFAFARWDEPPELDVEQGGAIVFRHSALSSGATWADGVSIADPLAANTASAILPLRAGTYMAKFVDSSGNYSASFASFYQPQASVLAFSTLASSTQSPTFAGTKTNAIVVDSLLRLDAAGDFDAVPSVDALTSWDWYGGVKPSGSYAFASKIDLASVRKVRLTAVIAALMGNVNDSFDDRTAEVDDWPSWDATVSGNEADAVLSVRSTSDDPASGGASWSGWQRLDSADFNARGFDLSLELTSNDPSYSPYVSTLGVVVENI